MTCRKRGGERREGERREGGTEGLREGRRDGGTEGEREREVKLPKWEEHIYRRIQVERGGERGGEMGERVEGERS